MANTYKNITITPNSGSTTDDPKIQFSGGNTSVNTDITLRVYPLSNGALSFEGSAGQLFSITNDLTGSIFTVNDVSGIPSIEVLANGVIKLAEFGGNTGIAVSLPTEKLDVGGNVKIRGTCTDDKGEARTLVLNSQIVSYTLVANDHGKTVSSNSNITIPVSIFSAGQVITLYNNSAASITVIGNTSGLTLYLAGTANTGSRTLAQRGLATVLCTAANNFVISGAGVS